MSNISGRVVEVIDNLGIRQSDFADKTTIGRSTLNSTIKRGAELKSDAIRLIKEAYPNLNLEWFLTGEGKMWKDDVRDEDKTRAELLMKVQNLEDELKKANYILGTKENMIAGRGRRIERLETYVAELEYRIELMEKEQK